MDKIRTIAQDISTDDARKLADFNLGLEQADGWTIIAAYKRGKNVRHVMLQQQDAQAAPETIDPSHVDELWWITMWKKFAAWEKAFSSGTPDEGGLAEEDLKAHIRTYAPALPTDVIESYRAFIAAASAHGVFIAETTARGVSRTQAELGTHYSLMDQARTALISLVGHYAPVEESDNGD